MNKTIILGICLLALILAPMAASAQYVADDDPYDADGDGLPDDRDGDGVTDENDPYPDDRDNDGTPDADEDGGTSLAGILDDFCGLSSWWIWVLLGAVLILCDMTNIMHVYRKGMITAFGVVCIIIGIYLGGFLS